MSFTTTTTITFNTTGCPRAWRGALFAALAQSVDEGETIADETGEVPDVEVEVEAIPGWSTPATYWEPSDGMATEILSVVIAGSEFEIMDLLSGAELRSLERLVEEAADEAADEARISAYCDSRDW